MEVKKSPKANLENFTKIFMLIGLVVALFVSYQGIEYSTVQKIDTLAQVDKTIDDEEEIPMTEQKIEEVKPPPPPPPPAPEQIEVVEDEKEVEETILESTETDEKEVIEVQETEIVEVEEEEEVVEDVPFAVIEQVPIFPGCKGSNAKLKQCMQDKITKHVQKKFNAELANELGLDPGRKRISVQFKIDKYGRVSDIRARAPHPRLKKEAIRIIKLLPKMSPGKQRNKPVNVRYNLPINFVVEE
jgi:protein TonB